MPGTTEANKFLYYACEILNPSATIPCNRPTLLSAKSQSHIQYQLKTLVLPAREWDKLIARFETKQVFHESGWLEFLEQSQGGRRMTLEISNGSGVVGYFCGMTIRKGPFLIFGSPLHGWGTPNLGPIVDRKGFDTAAFLQALSLYSKKNKVDLLEICCDWMESSALEAAGFRAAPDVTHTIQLTTVEDAWAGMFKTTRNYVRRAEKNGIEIEVAETEEVAHDHFEQLKAVFARKGQVPPYGMERPLLQWRCLRPTGRIMILRAIHDGRCIATYVLVYDDHGMWGLATASFPDALDLRPNELIHWRAIEMASQMKIPYYDFCGGGDYKKKYGAKEVPRIRWIRAYSRLAGAAYDAYGRWHSVKRSASAAIRRWKP